MLPNTTQVSLKSALEAMITWKKCTMQKSSSAISSKKQDIFHIVMTPDRIPKFIIPSLDVEHVRLHLETLEDVEDFELSAQQVTLSPKAKRSHSDSNLKKAQLLRGRSLCKKASDYSTGELDKILKDSDPSTRAALSLPHLSKIKTPYGFLTLGESPNIRRKESLYFDVDAMQTPTVLSMKSITRSITRNMSSPLRKQVTCKACPNTPKKPARSISLEVLCCSTASSSSLPSSTTLEGCSLKCEKKKFRLLKWKHFAGGRCFKCNGENKEKVPVMVGRTRSNPIP